MTPLELVEYIAHDYIESSHDKIRVQRDDYIRLAKKVLDEVKSEEVESFSNTENKIYEKI